MWNEKQAYRLPMCMDIQYSCCSFEVKFNLHITLSLLQYNYIHILIIRSKCNVYHTGVGPIHSRHTRQEMTFSPPA